LSVASDVEILNTQVERDRLGKIKKKNFLIFTRFDAINLR
jgi:hypothetical protein